MELSFKCSACGERLPYYPAQIGTLLDCPMCGNQIPIPLTTTAVGMVENDLWLQKHVGSGNIGDVYAGKHLATQSKAFLKVLSPAVAPTPDCVQTFLYEMSRWQQVEDPHFLAFSAAGMIADQVCLVTPYIEGECLDTIVERQGPMKEKSALKIATKVASLLRRAWKDHGLCHRDLRPSNILLTDKGEVYLLDMGNVKRNLTNGSTSLAGVDFQGTVADFMAPEEHEETVDVAPTLDIYALGATLFYLLTAHQPFTGSDSTQVIRRHLFAKVPNAKSHEPSVSDQMAKLIKDMMVKDPKKRLQTWREVGERLKKHLKRHTQRVATGELQIATQAAAGNKLTAGGPNLKVLAAVGLAALLLLPLLAIGTYLLSQSSVPDDDPEPIVRKVEQPTRQTSRSAPKRTATKQLSASDIPKVTIRVTADDQHTTYLNGKLLGTGRAWRNLQTYRNLQLKAGKNVVAICGKNLRRSKWVFCELEIAGNKIGRSDKWRGSSVMKPGWEKVDFDDSSWDAAKITHYGGMHDANWDYKNTPAKPVWLQDETKDECYLRFTLNIKGK